MSAPDPICDFCSSLEIAWAYPCTNFGITAVMMGLDGRTFSFPWASEGAWAACDECAAYIESDDWDGLAQRCVDTSPALIGMQEHLVQGEVKKAIAQLHVQFRKRKLERVPVVRESDIQWSRMTFQTIMVGGVWAVPRSGLVIQKVSDEPPVMKLQSVMPHTSEMPMDAKELRKFQRDDLKAIQRVFGAAGIEIEGEL